MCPLQKDRLRKKNLLTHHYNTPLHILWQCRWKPYGQISLGAGTATELEKVVSNRLSTSSNILFFHIGAKCITMTQRYSDVDEHMSPKKTPQKWIWPGQHQFRRSNIEDIQYLARRRYSSRAHQEELMFWKCFSYNHLAELYMWIDNRPIFLYVMADPLRH